MSTLDKIDLAEFLNERFQKINQRTVELQKYLEQSEEYDTVMRLTNQGITNYLYMIHNEEESFNDYWEKQIELFEKLNVYRRMTYLTDALMYSETFELISILEQGYVSRFIISKTGYLVLLNIVLIATYQQKSMFEQLDPIAKPLAKYLLSLKKELSDESSYDNQCAADLSKLIDQATVILKSYLD